MWIPLRILVSHKRYIIRDYGFLLYEFSRCVFNFDLKTRKHWNSTFKWFWGNLLGFDTLKKNHHCVSIRENGSNKMRPCWLHCIFNPDKLNDYLTRSRGGEKLGFNCFYRKVRTGGKQSSSHWLCFCFGRKHPSKVLFGGCIYWMAKKLLQTCLFVVEDPTNSHFCSIRHLDRWWIK